MNRLNRETGYRLPRRGRQGFALIAVLGITAILLLLVSTLFLKAGVAHQDGISERSSTDSFYAAEAGMQSLTGRLSQLQLGSAAIPKAQLQINSQQIISTANATQSTVTADVANGQIKAGQAYGSTGATPQNLGGDLGYVVYSFKAYNGNTQICTQLCDLPASGVTRVEVEVLGFKGRSAATTLKTSINAGTGTPANFFASNPYAVLSLNGGVDLGNGSIVSGKPFLKSGSTVYVQSVCVKAGVYTVSTSSSSCASGATKVVDTSSGVLAALALLGYTPIIPALTTNYNYLPQGDQGDVASIDSSVDGNKATVNGSVTAYGCSTSSCIGSKITATGGKTSKTEVITLPDPPLPPAGATSLSIDLSGNSSQTILPGSYIVTKLKTSGNGNLIMTGPVTFYLSSTATVDISGNGDVNNGSSANLQIYGNKSNTNELKFSGNGKLAAMVYAPQSSIKVSGNGQMTGAIVAKAVGFSGGNALVSYDESLGSTDLAVKGTTTGGNVTASGWQRL